MGADHATIHPEPLVTPETLIFSLTMRELVLIKFSNLPSTTPEKKPYLEQIVVRVEMPLALGTDVLIRDMLPVPARVGHPK